MRNKKAKPYLKKLGACPEGLDWVGDRTIEEAWNDCPKGDWMLWAYAKTYPEDIRGLTLAKGHCANTVRHLMKDKRSRDGVDAAIAYGEGRIGLEELEAARIAAYAANAHAAVNAHAAADAYAVAAAAHAAADAYAVAVAAHAAADAANARAAAAMYAVAADAVAAYAANARAAACAAAACAAARDKSRQETADICRRYLTIKEWGRLGMGRKKRPYCDSLKRVG